MSVTTEKPKTAAAQSLTLTDLVKTYASRGRESVTAVKGIDLAIEPGELVALLGPSGCGKTTTLRMIAGLETVTSGSIRIGDREISQLPASKRGIGVGFESYALYPPMSVRDNLLYGLKARKVKGAEQMVESISSRLEMDAMMSLRPAGLSSGQKQRVALARALVRNPPVLLLDEPLSHLDASARQRVRRELKVLQREFGYTTIVVTHDQVEALSLADRLAVMDAGVVQQFGTPDEVFDDPANLFVAQFVGEPQINVLSGVAKSAGSRTTVEIGSAAGALETNVTGVADGTRVTVGVRPQDCSISTGDGAGIHTTIAYFEHLLEFGLATSTVSGVEEGVVVQTPAQHLYGPEQQVVVNAPADRVYLFDIDTGGAVAVTKLFNDPARFAEDMLAGFLDANAKYVIGVPGGVVRAHVTPPGKVAVVIGGGSGHYPAFCGTVGVGFADGAVVGNIFTSPSAEEAASVARAAHGDAGVLLTTGNYAGDVMNFGLAVTQLRSEGIDAHYFAVTDDIASAPAGEEAKRRGIAGDFTVFKCASAAAEDGLDLAGVIRVAEASNAATRTLGVAFDGCTLPGADAPLFTVPDKQMGVGLGIHGEPGVRDEPMPSAADLAVTLVDGVLADRPDGASRRIGVILNGLGRTKYEELYVVWGTASRLLRERGYQIVEPEVGELVTSLDMAGCSLTVMWLDDELEKYWTAPADTPAYRKGVAAQSDSGDRRTNAVADAETVTPDLAELADDEGRSAGRLVALALDAVADMLADAEDELGRIDAVAGDGDHGRGMVKGSSAARAAAAKARDDGAGQGSVLAAAGKEWAAKAGGTSGVLWGALLTAVGARLGDTGQPDGAVVAAGIRDGYDALVTLGGASPGDKTMLDALLPFSDELQRRIDDGETWQDAWRGAADVATAAALATADLRPKIGRARPLAERSVGTPDAGATSLAMIAHTMAGTFVSTSKEDAS